MALLVALALCLVFNGEATVPTEAVCPDNNVDHQSMLQTTVRETGLEEIRQQRRQDSQDVAKTFEAMGTVAHIEAVKLEQAFNTLSDAAKDVQAAGATTNAAMGFEAQAADAFKLALQETQQVKDMQQTQAYQEANVTQVLHEAVQRLEANTAFGSENNDLLQRLRSAEGAQAVAIKDAAREDQVLLGLSSTMAAAAQAATTAKLVDETQTAQMLGSAITELQAVQGSQLESTKDAVNLAKSVQLFQGSADAMAMRQQQSADAMAMRQQQELQRKTQRQYRNRKLQSKVSVLESRLAKAAQEARAEATAEHRKAEIAQREAETTQRQASAMYQAASATQASSESQASKTAQSLRAVAAEASHAAQLLQGVLGNTAPIS